MKYRKKPVVIEAVQIDCERWFATEISDWPDWVQDAIEAGTLTDGPLMRGVNVHTAEGVMYGDDGDWLIQGVKGELYACKPDIFELTYEPASVPLSPEGQEKKK